MKSKKFQCWAWLFALPFSVGFLLFQMLPVGLNFIQTLFLGPRFVGLSNYAAVLGSSSFQLALGNTVQYLLLALPLGMVLSLLLALVVFHYWRRSALLQASFLFPLAVPCAVTVALLRLFFQEDGVANAALRQLGLPQQDWLASVWAFCILLGLYLWKNLGYNIILLLAGLSAVPESCLEAARVDGASGWQRFHFIIAPLLKPQLYFVLLVSLANAFKNFREMLLLGGDTPDSSVYLLQHYINNNFAYGNYARLGVASVCLFGIMFLIVAALYRKMGWLEE